MANEDEGATAASARWTVADALSQSIQFDAPLWDVPGEYRRIVEFPRDLSWTLAPDEELTRQELGSSSRSDASSSDDDAAAAAAAAGDVDIWTSSHGLQLGAREPSPAPAATENALHSLRLEFVLPRDVSPWMLIRELCKLDRFVIDEAAKRARENRVETKRAAAAEVAAIRYRIYKRVTAQHLRYQSLSSPTAGAGQSLHSARLWQSVFHHNGMRDSLMPSKKGWDDVHD